MNDLTVACVLRTGGFRGRYYTASWVMRLRDMVARHLTAPHNFVCLSNITFELPGIEARRLDRDYPGWWSKIELFGPLLQDTKRVLYLDLDVFIVDSLDPLITRAEPMVLLPALVTKPKAGCVRKYQSSCMLWTPPAGKKIYDKFSMYVPDSFRGDQDWIGHVMPECATFDRKIVCKLGACEHGVPPGVSLVLAVGGKNGEAAARFPWARDAWYGPAESSLSQIS